MKTINGHLRPEAHEHLRYASGGREDILVADASLPGDALAALFARADCYVSLHRSEGFGLTLAEAMILGKPVIGTAYGGNTDFMTPLNSYLVDWTLREVGPEAEHYPAAGHWAEPSVEHAAALMRAVVDDPGEAARRGARARGDIEAALSPAAVGGIARARLDRIVRAPDRFPDVGGADVLDEVEHRLAFDLAGGAGAAGMRGTARRAVLRALKPYTVGRAGARPGDRDRRAPALGRARGGARRPRARPRPRRAARAEAGGARARAPRLTAT